MNRTVAKKVRLSVADPTKWRDDPEKGAGRLDSFLRAVHRPHPPTADDLAKLSTSVKAILSRPRKPRRRG